MSAFEPYPPDDLDEFWGEATEEAMRAPLDAHRSLRNEFDLAGFTVETLWFRGVHGEKLHGWLAYEPGARRLPGFLWIPPYGRESLLPNQYGTRRGFISISLNFFGHEPFHQEKYVTSRGYFAEGVEDPGTWIFRRMLQNAMIAARLLQAQVEADEDRIGVMGMSQGGGMAIWMGAYCPVVRAVCADMPFLAAMPTTIVRNAHRYPMKELIDFAESVPLGRERLMNTLAYFDTLNLATRCGVPTHVSSGLKDPSCRPDTVEAVFEALPGRKMLRTYDWGHDWHPDMIENNRTWMIENLR
ncbi:MAG TPA: acetylxylan esterase [Fimbriimonadaceae bacterium]|nr:acetylxylan esterase [Fimbriimonadaceae bacterium]